MSNDDKCPKCGMRMTLPAQPNLAEHLHGIDGVYCRSMQVVQLRADKKRLQVRVADVCGWAADALQARYAAKVPCALDMGGHHWRAGVEWALRELRGLTSVVAAHQARKDAEENPNE